MDMDLVFAAQLQKKAYDARKRLAAGEIQPTAHVMRSIKQLDTDARYHLFLGMGGNGQDAF